MEQQKGGPRAEGQQKQGNATGVGNLGGVFCSKQQELPAHLISQEDQHSPSPCRPIRRKDVLISKRKQGSLQTRLPDTTEPAFNKNRGALTEVRGNMV